MRIVLQNSIVDYHLATVHHTRLMKEAFAIIIPRAQKGSLQVSEKMTVADLWQFLSLSWLLSGEMTIFGNEKIPGGFLEPSRIGVRVPLKLHDYLTEYYRLLYREEEIILDSEMNQYSRLQIGSEIFGSKMSPRYAKNARILAKWQARSDESIDTYPGETQYYFEHTVKVSGRRKKHQMAFIHWFKQVNSTSTHFKHRIDREDISNTELWCLDIGPEGRDSIMPVHQILGRFVKAICVGANSTRQYLCVIPLNRRFNI